MTGKTHVIGGVQAALVMAAFVKPDMTGAEAAMCGACAVIGSLVPDIDTNGTVTEEDVCFRACSTGLKALGVKHRGATHTLWCSALFAMLAGAVAEWTAERANADFAFYAAMLVFLAIHVLGLLKPLRKVGSLVALAVYGWTPRLMTRLGEAASAIADAGVMGAGAGSGSGANGLGNAFAEWLIQLSQSVDVNLPIRLIALSVFAGCISHLIYDSLNPQGIMWLHPLVHKRFHFPLVRIRSDSAGEGIFACLMAAVCFVWGYFLIRSRIG